MQRQSRLMAAAGAVLFAAAMGGLLAASANSMQLPTVPLLAGVFAAGVLAYWVAAYALLLEKSSRLLVGRFAALACAAMRGYCRRGSIDSC